MLTPVDNTFEVWLVDGNRGASEWVDIAAATAGTYHPATGDRLSIVETSALGTGDKEIIFDYDDDGTTSPMKIPPA